MEAFGNRLYELRKKTGMSQEKLAEKLNVTRQTLSKWELGESTPDMEKLIAMSDLFDISLDELMLGRETAPAAREKETGLSALLRDKISDEGSRQKAKKAGKILLILFGVMLAVDIISMIIFFLVWGSPT